MRAIALTLLVAMVVALQPRYAWAPFVEETYEDYTRTMRSREADIAAANHLDQSETTRAGDYAALWVHIFPCDGDQRGLSARVPSLAQFMLNANPTVPLQAAVLQIVAAQWVQNHGRTTPHICRYAAERVKQAVRAHGYR
jgi:hypothetical protein